MAILNGRHARSTFFMITNSKETMNAYSKREYLNILGIVFFNSTLASHSPPPHTFTHLPIFQFV
ncbi:hypothetical protein HZS_4987 [Henneguya salminicola]|nr:hypothetical protein HZS_4987 [Henneguya salminicola]